MMGFLNCSISRWDSRLYISLELLYFFIRDNSFFKKDNKGQGDNNRNKPHPIDHPSRWFRHRHDKVASVMICICPVTPSHHSIDKDIDHKTNSHPTKDYCSFSFLPSSYCYECPEDPDDAQAIEIAQPSGMTLLVDVIGRYEDVGPKFWMRYASGKRNLRAYG